MTAALEGTGVFAGKPDIVREECVLKGAAYGNVWMYVLHELEEAIEDIAVDRDPEAAKKHWDEGWAFYAGSLEGRDGSGQGTLLYNLADKRCRNFQTCNSGGTALANVHALESFQRGQACAASSDTACMRHAFSQIVEQMTIPPVEQSICVYGYRGECISSSFFCCGENILA